jgi:DNA-directed RNA polymerase specialized sigma subunit
MADYSDNYRRFLSELYKELEGVKLGANLEAQLRLLFKLEDDYRNILTKYQKGQKVYEKFHKYITQELKDIRQAKVYFRERDKVGFYELPAILKSGNYKEMARFKINLKFIQWSMGQDLPHRKELVKITKGIIEVRKKIVQENLPLVINRSRIFQIKAKKSNMDPLDLIQIATDGFMTAIDKFVPQSIHKSHFGKFKSTAVGWMTNKLIFGCIEGALKLTTSDKKILYRANIAIYRLGMKEISEILEFVKVTYPNVKESQLADIISSAGQMASFDGKDREALHYVNTEYSPNDMEESIVKNNLISKLRESIKNLEILESKVILLRGGIRDE